MSDNTMPERITQRDARHRPVEYIRADVAQAQLDAASERIERLSIELEQTRKAEVEARYYDAYQMNEIESMQAIIKERDARIAELEAARARWVDALADEKRRADFLHGAIERMKKHIAELEAAQAQAWVSVDERLPEQLTDVLVCDGSIGGISVGYMPRPGTFWNVNGWSASESVTHWMPLPPPPQP